MSLEDMTYEVGIGDKRKPGPRATAKAERHLARMRRRNGVLHRLRILRAGARMGVRQWAVGAARQGMASASARVGLGAAARTPVGAILTAAVVAFIVGAKLITGKTFDQMGEEVNQMLLGDMDEKARAKRTVREAVQGDQDLSRIQGITGKHNQQIAKIMRDMYAMEYRNEVGATIMRREFRVPSTLDLLIESAARAFKQKWTEVGGPFAFERMMKAMTPIWQGARLLSGGAGIARRALR